MKRKYTRKESKSDVVKQESSINLSPGILESIEKTCEHRRNLGLYNDRKERIQRALRYQEFRRGKK